MQPANFNRQFINKFRQEYICYPHVEEQQYQNFLFRQFTGIGNDISFIGNWLSHKTDDTETRKQLAGNLETKNIPCTDRLLRQVQNFNKFLSSSAQKEPYAADYYYLLLADSTPFFSLVSSFREKIQLQLLNKLASHTANEPYTVEMFDKELGNLLAGMEVDTGRICKYYDYFIFLLKEESANNRDIALLTQVGDYLQKMISFTEKLLVAIECTQSELEKWRTELTSLESQELYN